jgi:hypothetical protein
MAEDCSAELLLARYLHSVQPVDYSVPRNYRKLAGLDVVLFTCRSEKPLKMKTLISS